MQVTLFEKTSDTNISNIEWMELMKRIRNGYWRDIVEKSRREATGYDELKRRLPAFGISVTFTGGDEAANVVRYNHIIGIDFNKVITDIHNGPNKIVDCREACLNIPSVIGFFTTKSGRGFRVFVKVDTDLNEHKIIYHPIQEYFERLFNLQADDKYQDITRLSFVSYDSDCFYRDVENAQSFPIYKILPGKLNISTNSDKISDKIFKVRRYLNDTYDFRFNTLTSRMQCRIKPETKNALPTATEWHDIDDQLNDTIVCDVNANCVNMTYNQMKWIMDNHCLGNIFNPVTAYLDSLPTWDGTDRIIDQKLKTFLCNMVHKWTDEEFRIDNSITLPFEDAVKILPSELHEYMSVGPYGERRNSLLIIEECSPDNHHRYSGKASVIYATHKKNDGGSTLTPICYPMLYGQLKIISF